MRNNQLTTPIYTATIGLKRNIPELFMPLLEEDTNIGIKWIATMLILIALIIIGLFLYNRISVKKKKDIVQYSTKEYIPANKLVNHIEFLEN